MAAAGLAVLHATITEYDEKRHEALKHFEEAVRRAKFLNKQQKIEWGFLGYFLTNEELQETEDLILQEDLYRLQFKHQLYSIKPKTN